LTSAWSDPATEQVSQGQEEEKERQQEINKRCLGQREILDGSKGREGGSDVFLGELKLERPDVDATGQLLIGWRAGRRLERQLLLLLLKEGLPHPSRHASHVGVDSSATAGLGLGASYLLQL